jgi:hypothetical protein
VSIVNEVPGLERSPTRLWDKGYQQICGVISSLGQWNLWRQNQNRYLPWNAITLGLIMSTRKNVTTSLHIYLSNYIVNWQNIFNLSDVEYYHRRRKGFRLIKESIRAVSIFNNNNYHRRTEWIILVRIWTVSLLKISINN